MAAHLRPRVQATTNRKGRSEPAWLKPAAGKCSGVLAGGLRLSQIESGQSGKIGWRSLRQVTDVRCKGGAVDIADGRQKLGCLFDELGRLGESLLEGLE
jgi:hypothetical protein